MNHDQLFRVGRLWLAEAIAAAAQCDLAALMTADAMHELAFAFYRALPR